MLTETVELKREKYSPLNESLQVMVRLFKKNILPEGSDVEYNKHLNCLIYENNHITYHFLFSTWAQAENKFWLCDEHLDTLLAYKINSYLFNNLRTNSPIIIVITTNLYSFNKEVKVEVLCGYSMDITKFFRPSLFRKNVNLDKLINYFNKRTELVKLFRFKEPL